MRTSNSRIHLYYISELYSKVDFGVDLQTRVALVGPNGAGKILSRATRIS